MRNRRLLGFVTLLLALVVLLLARCQPDAPQVFPDPQRFEGQTLPPGAQLPEVELRPGQDLAAEQIVVTGGGEDIDRVIGALGELGLERVTSTSYDYLERFPPPDGEDNQQQQQTQGKRLRAAERLQLAASLRTDLYQFTAGTPPLADTLQAIAAEVERQQGAMQVGVVAEPNYVVGFEITGDPWGIEGSPWGIEGSPWGIEGSGEDGVVHSSDRFWEQWALQAAPGINLYAPGAPPTARNVDPDGEGVQVAVFDTSPFGAEGGYRFVGWGPPEMRPLALTVSHPVALPTSLPAEEAGIADHGLFVSGLVYAAAPGSDIHLIRVLNDEGQGTLQGLVEALNIYVLERLIAQQSLQNTVINLSLGTAQPDDEELTPEARRAIARMLQLWDGRQVNEERLPVLSLEMPMLVADRYGASVVAAAGNDSAEQPAGSPLPAQIPAAYDSVVGVEAGNQTPQRACYSNEGDLLAPGGDGDADDDGNACVPAHNSCDTDSADCGFGVISYALVATRGFAYWVGTSFATPLASGLAADVIQDRDAPSPAEVQAALLCAAQGSGVVDAVAAIGSCP